MPSGRLWAAEGEEWWWEGKGVIQPVRKVAHGQETRGDKIKEVTAASSALTSH